MGKVSHWGVDATGPTITTDRHLSVLVDLLGALILHTVTFSHGQTPCPTSTYGKIAESLQSVPCLPTPTA